MPNEKLPNKYFLKIIGNMTLSSFSFYVDEGSQRKEHQKKSSICSSGSKSATRTDITMSGLKAQTLETVQLHPLILSGLPFPHLESGTTNSTCLIY